MPIALHMSVGQDHPRIRGEHKPGKSDDAFDAGSSPHTRGARYSSSRWSIRRGIIPAYAGSTDHSSSSSSCRSSPHTRGARGRRRELAPAPGIIPAYAGSTLRGSARSGCAPDHPRIRGEHPSECDEGHIVTGSSPHTRGALGLSVPPTAVLRIIPAYAGSTPFSLSPLLYLQDHPRIRGEHEEVNFDVHWGFRIIPAYAGSTKRL